MDRIRNTVQKHQLYLLYDIEERVHQTFKRWSSDQRKKLMFR